MQFLAYPMLKVAGTGLPGLILNSRSPTSSELPDLFTSRWP